MAEQVVGRLFAEPHLRKYLIRKLRRGVRGSSPNAEAISKRIVELLAFRVLIPESEPDELTHQRATLPLVLSGDNLSDIDLHTHKLIIKFISEQFHEEFYRTVDRMHYEAAVRVSKKAAILFFRSQYGLTEDDLPYRTSQRSYQRYEQSKGRKRPRGKPRGYRMSKGPDMSA